MTNSRAMAATGRLREAKFFTAMAVLLLATAVAGFMPNSIAILTGNRPSPPILVHLHAALMLGWLSLLVMQSSLNLLGRQQLHRSLGVAAFFFAPAVTLMLIATSFAVFFSDADIPERRYNILLLQLRSIVLFPLLVSLAIGARRSSPGTHKRYMIMATAIVLDAAIARIGWLPGTGAGHAGYELMSAYQLFLFAPLIAYDLISLGRLHRATVIGTAAFLVAAIIVNVLWGSPWWVETSSRLLDFG